MKGKSNKTQFKLKKLANIKKALKSTSFITSPTEDVDQTQSEEPCPNVPLMPSKAQFMVMITNAALNNH
jgi:hypothetical protein